MLFDVADGEHAAGEQNERDDKNTDHAGAIHGCGKRLANFGAKSASRKPDGKPVVNAIA
jgi:hypothetical protein